MIEKCVVKIDAKIDEIPEAVKMCQTCTKKKWGPETWTYTTFSTLSFLENDRFWLFATCISFSTHFQPFPVPISTVDYKNRFGEVKNNFMTMSCAHFSSKNIYKYIPISHWFEEIVAWWSRWDGIEIKVENTF